VGCPAAYSHGGADDVLLFIGSVLSERCSVSLGFCGVLGGLGGDLDLGGELAHELVLLGIGLESSMSVLGGGIDELDVKLLGLPGLGAGEEGLADNKRSLAGSHNTTLDEEVVLVDNTVMGEATDGGDVLVDGISVAHGVVGASVDGTGSDAVDLLMDLGTGMVTLLSTTSNSPLDCGWMPRSDTGDLTETSMRLTVKSRATESLDGSGHTFTAGNSDDVNDLVLLEDVTNLELLLEAAPREVDLVGDGATVDLDLHDVSLVLTHLQLADLSGAENAHNRAVLFDALEVTGNRVLVTFGLLVFVSVLGEGLLLGVHPVLVHSPLDSDIEVLGPDGGESAEAAGCLNVTDDTDDLHGRALNDGASVHDILLDHLLSFTTFLVLDDVGHTGLVAHEGGKVALGGGDIAGE